MRAIAIAIADLSAAAQMKSAPGSATTRRGGAEKWTSIASGQQTLKDIAMTNTAIADAPSGGSWSGGSDWRGEPDWRRQSRSQSQFDRGTEPWQGNNERDAGTGRNYGSMSSGTGNRYAGGSWSSGGFSGGSSGFTDRSGQGSFAGRGPRNYQRSDERIREEVNERLTDDHRVDASDIEVEVRNGEVILRGRVDERRDKRMAEEVVENLPGVKDVRNELRVERSGGWFSGGDRDRNEGDRNRDEGSIGHTGNPQQRDDVTSLNLSGAASETPGNMGKSAREREKNDKK